MDNNGGNQQQVTGKGKGINDPIHGYIWVPEGIVPIIDNPFFQRLGYVSQLTMSDKVFPNACITRKAHSLGVMHVAGKYADHLFSP